MAVACMRVICDGKCKGRIASNQFASSLMMTRASYTKHFFGFVILMLQRNLF